MELASLKEIIIVILFVVVLLCVAIPLTFAHNAQRGGVDIFHSERYEKIVSILNCFAAGIFLGTCLLHLFPDVRQNVTQAVLNLDPNQTFPFAEFTIAMGFFLLLTIEQILSDVRQRRFQKYAHLQQISNDPCAILDQPVMAVPIQNSDPVESDISDVSTNQINPSDNDRSRLVNDAEDTSALVRSQQSYSSYDTDCHVSPNGRVSPRTQQRQKMEMANDYASIRIVAMIVALSIHSTFEGIAIGVQCTQEEVIQITSALAIHKVVIAFSLGLGLVQSPLGTLKSALFGLLFAVTTPFGIGVGLGVTWYESDLNGSLIVGTLQGMAAGTFLYVTFLDVLPHEFKSGKFHLPKLLSFIIGFSVICLSLFLFPDN